MTTDIKNPPEDATVHLNRPLPQDVLDSIQDKLKLWGKMAGLLHFTVITFGTIAIGSSLLITAFVGTDYWGDKDRGLIIKILAFLTTLFLTLITSFNLVSKANNCRKAWRHLNNAIYNYKAEIINGGALIKAYENGEIIMGAVDFNFNKDRKN